MPSDEQMNAYLTKIKEVIKEYGWMVQGVFPVDPGDLGFAYTVGLTEAGLPELVISGTFNEQAKSLLNTAGHVHLKTELKHGDVADAIANVDFRVIDAPDAEVNTARRLYGWNKVRAVQLVWPDENGLWPGSAFGSVKQELFGKAWW